MRFWRSTGNKNDRIDARKLAELLRNGSLSAAYHGEDGLRTFKELSRSYMTLSRDLTRVMNRPSYYVPTQRTDYQSATLNPGGHTRRLSPL